MKGFIIALAVVCAFAVPTMLGFIPAFLGVPAMLVTIIMKDVIFLVLARGLPMAMIGARAMGGLLWGVMEKTGNIAVGKFRPKGGMTFTKGHGAYNTVTEGIVKLDGVPFAVAPEETGYNVKLEHLELLAELQRRGINNILEIIDTNEHGQFKNFKDDKRIRDIKNELKVKLKPGDINGMLNPRAINLPGLNDFHRYAIESAHPFRQDANIQIGIAQEARGAVGKSPWPWIAAIGIIGIICLTVIFMLTREGGKQ